MGEYKIVSYMRIEPEEQELMTKEEAEQERTHLEFMQPENIYTIEEIE